MHLCKEIQINYFVSDDAAFNSMHEASYIVAYTVFIEQIKSLVSKNVYMCESFSTNNIILVLMD